MEVRNKSELLILFKLDMNMKKFLIKLIHWFKFHTAIPKPTKKSLNIPDEDILGAIVRLKNDPKKEEFEVIGSGPISRGPMRQFSPSISFLCRRPLYGYETSKEKHYDYTWFRKDSLVFIR